MALSALAILGAGCASPGPPRAPSLGLPEPVSDLSASRRGPDVELRFTPPWRTADGLLLRAGTFPGTLCRSVEAQACIPVGPTHQVTLTGKEEAPPVAAWNDALPPALASGPARLLSYRVEFRGLNGRSAGPSEPAYTAAGQAPPAVQDFAAEGSRAGVILHWRRQNADHADILLRREDSASAGKSIWFNAAAAPTGSANRSLDGSARPDVPYRYVALRRQTVNLGGRTLEIRSAESAPVAFTLRETFPPAQATDLHAAGYMRGTGFVVDLIWNPVEDARLAGYVVYRQALDASGKAAGERLRLNAEPVVLPSFQDAHADAATRSRYSVAAVDAKGNESPPVSVIVEPQPR